MASYFNLTLDTTAPSGLTLQINDGALYATSTAVKLTIGVSDEQTTGYQMKIWGIDGVAEMCIRDRSWTVGRRAIEHSGGQAESDCGRY